MKGLIQTKFESEPGNESNTPVLSTKTLYTPATSVEFGVEPSHDDRSDELRGISDQIPVDAEAFNPTLGVEFRAYADPLVVFLKAAVGAPTITDGDGSSVLDPDGNAVPVGAYLYEFELGTEPATASPQTLQHQLVYKNGTAVKVKGHAISNVSISNPESGGVRIKPEGPALYVEPIADPALTAAYTALSVLPFRRSGLQLTWGLSGSSISTDFSVNVSNPVEALRTMGIASKYPDAMELADELPSVTGSISKRHFDGDDLSALLEAEGFSATAKWVADSNIGATSYPYSMWLEMPNVQLLSGGPDAMTNARRTGANYEWKASSPDGTTPSATITVVCATPSLD